MRDITELYRELDPRRPLERDEDALHVDWQVFVSTLFPQQWLDIDDVQPEDLVPQVVRQLVADLQRAELSFGEGGSELPLLAPRRASRATSASRSRSITAIADAYALRQSATIASSPLLGG